MKALDPNLEITLRAVILSVILAAVLGGANAYLGLFAGTTLSASIPAAVMSMAILRLFRGATVRENNIVQTAASAAEALAGGVVFTLPALILIGTWTGFNYVETGVIAGLGGAIGVLFTIPLRRALIVESSLTFPEGVATAEVLRAGDRGSAEVRFIMWPALAGLLFKVGQTGVLLWSGSISGAMRLGGSAFAIGLHLSPALLSVGFIVGLRVAVLIFAGGAINWLVVVPLVAAQHPWPIYDALPLSGGAAAWAHFVSPAVGAGTTTGQPVETLTWAFRIWTAQTRYLGVGAMVVGGLWALVKLRHTLSAALSTGVAAYRRERAATVRALDRKERDLPMPFVVAALAVLVPALGGLCYYITGSVIMAALVCLFLLVAGFLFSAVAAYMAGLVGSANNPISGITIATVLSSAFVLLLLFGEESRVGPAAAILIGAAVSCAAAVASDNMQDLKAGRLVGATPYKQQIMQGIGVLVAALVMAPVLNLLLDAYGIGVPTPEHPNPLKAPQATLVAAVAQGAFHGGIPWPMVSLGALLAAGVVGLDSWLEHRGATFRAPVLAVAVGLYLPLELSATIFTGGLIGLGLARIRGRRGDDRRGEPGAAKELGETGRRGLLAAAGLISGEAMAGILLAVPIVALGSPTALAIFGVHHHAWPGLLLLVGLVLFVGRLITSRDR